MKIQTISVTLTLLMVTSFANCGSIWAQGRVSNIRSSMFEDDKARNIGDVLTVKIDEGSDISTKKDRKLDKTSENSGEGGGSFDLGDMLPGIGRLKKTFRMPNYKFDNKSGSKFDGKGEYSTKNSYVDQITVVVEDVMPNGNLLVLGKRTREVAGQKTTIQASGIVRPSDIDADNIIASTRVANFHIVYVDRGMENNFLRPGWLTRIWNLLNPF
ncbi:MAG: hypothetical protein DRP83_01490 [Planctomycetota bacterium]|nr:MAG: hypothetical protein DRP83_01490 [Planctomycetota bacterium]